MADSLPTITLIVPIPPSLNNAYTNGRRHGRRVLTKQGREYKADVVQRVLLFGRPMNGFELVINVPTARLGLTLKLHFPDRRRTDVSNRVKLLEDALSEAFDFDDCRVDRLLVERAGIDPVNPRCEVTLEVLS